MKLSLRFALAALAALVVTVPVSALPGLGLTALGGSHATTRDASTMGQWETPFEGQAAAVNMVLLHDGSVLYWSGVEAGNNDNVFFLSYPIAAQSRVLHPGYTAAQVTTPADPQGLAGDLFCSGQTVLPDGRVLTAGGSNWTELTDGTTDVVRGLKDARAYDPATGAWTRYADMQFARWYPTVFTDANGNAVAASGISNLTDPVTLDVHHEVYDASANSWSIDPAMESNLLPMYPRLFVVPGGPLKGDIYYQPDATLWGPFGEHPLEPLWAFEQVADKNTGDWSFLAPAVFGVRQHANSIMLPLDPANGYAPQILTYGGTLERTFLATSTSEIANLATNPPTNTMTASLNHARWYPNGVLLPDGTVLATGGGLYDTVIAHGQPNIPVLTAEQYDPASNTWTDMADATVPRMYHSTAILLPDGRVLTGGHVPLPVPWKAVRDNVPMENQTVETRLEIYDPPYLFRGPRPVIDNIDQENATYGGAVQLETHQAATIESAVLIRPGSTTHAWDSNEREVKLDITARDANHLTIAMPPDGDVAAPGWYMLFINGHTDQGPVPSVATWVHLG
ncbi:MAG: galactose oxidase-like domain-containing protein [Thermoplasmatota archaeon]